MKLTELSLRTISVAGRPGSTAQIQRPFGKLRTVASRQDVGTLGVDRFVDRRAG